MARSAECVIRQSLERITNVQDNFTLIGRLDILKVTKILLVLHLQAANRVLEKHRDASEISMLGDPSRAAVGQLGCWNGWIMEDAELVLGLIVKESHIGLGDPEGCGKGGQDLQLDLEAAFVEAFHEMTEAWKLLFRNPEVIDQIVVWRAIIDGFLDLLLLATTLQMFGGWHILHI